MDGLITLVNPNLVWPAVAPYALDVLATALTAAGYHVEVLDLTFRRDDWRAALNAYFAERRPMLVGVTIRNTDSVYALEQRSFVGDHRAIVQYVRQCTPAPVVAGGVGFSTMPFALVDHLGVDFGVKGPGERILVDLCEALRSGGDPRSVAGLLVNEGGGRITRVPPPALGRVGVHPAGIDEPRAWQVDRVAAYRRGSGEPHQVDNLAYYRRSGLGSILVKSGCVYRCTQCVEPDAKGTGFARRDVAAVVDELESLVAQGIVDVHTADSEFNLSVAHSKAFLREIVRRKAADSSGPLHGLRLWVYCQPAPFDEEFAELLAAAGCAGVNVGADHVRQDMLARWKVTGGGTTYYTFENTARLVKLCHKYAMKTMVEALLGMPGETAETLHDCVDAFLQLDAEVTAFSLGLRLFPWTGLGVDLARQCAGVRTVPGLQSNTAREPIVLKTLEQCSGPVEYERQFFFDQAGRTRLVCYFSPDLPEDPDTLSRPDGRWHRTIELLRDAVPENERYRVMVPTLAGMSESENNYADNPFLTALSERGYTGAFWSYWRERATIASEGDGHGRPE